MKVTSLPNWADALAATRNLFKGSPDDPTPVHNRDVFYVQLLADLGALDESKHIVDLGAGLTWVDTILRKLGPKVTLVDDYGGGGGVDRERREAALAIIARLRSEFGIGVAELDCLKNPLPFPDASVDAVTCFHSMEHWADSPKPLFAEILRILKPGGHVIFAVPNAVNLRKRLTVLLGRNNWCPLNDWYHEPPPFRGHVREPVLADLHQIFAWNGLQVKASYGRNFIGRDIHSLSWLPLSIRHMIADVSEKVLQFFPTLCSDIHVVGQKPR